VGNGLSFEPPRAGKGDHRHYGDKESRYVFTTPEKLIADFQRDIARWNHENRDA
jgi:hypothetical protein